MVDVVHLGEVDFMVEQIGKDAGASSSGNRPRF
jgi:hypothetical protein